MNVVGFWAETELFGGVVLFERAPDRGSEVINAFLHPQCSPNAFQLSEAQLTSFADLAATDRATTLASAGSILPFVKEPEALTVPTVTGMGEAPLRIYKSEYDKPPPILRLPEENCVVMQGDENDPRAASMEKAWRDVREKFPELLRPETDPQDTKSSASGPSSSKDGPPSTKREGS